ncbi:soluble lamin-associated protein of 75 kDa isoform X2 [Tachysurus fulvidraco]|uniref:soluble lamin-associated protein of 75 kDa isoform X2 n=1 Tax=Tachysurus fulvidraco TaxID=1234273 RepID=UPI001FEFD5A6|nr:soluble lamin-associated protein of 75 kDa isoform X2 [Tachysurus fulvidraco]
MEFPVDVLEATSHGELERSARSYMNELLYADPDHAQYFTLPGGKEVQISLSSVGFVPLYGANLQHKILALFTPQDQHTAVALFLANKWYSMEDILKTANSKRDRLIKVRTVGERIVLYVLNRIVYRTKEMGCREMPFLCHGENDYAKILWKNGQAVGFYSVKPKGSLCNNYLGQCYFLPVMDSIFVRKAHRGKGYGLQILEDFVDSFNEDELGLRYPLSPAMTNVCRHYLDRYPADVDLFWEVESVGGPYQRTKVAYKLSSIPLNDTHKGDHGGGSGQNGDVVEDEVEEPEDTSFNITEDILVFNKHHKVTEELDTPISTRTRSSEHRRRKRVRDEQEPKGVDSRPDKINRVEITEEEKKELQTADGVSVESMPEAPTETLVSHTDTHTTLEVNYKQAENNEGVKEGTDEEDESGLENSSGVEGGEDMEVEEVSEEHKAPVQKFEHTQDDAHTEDTQEVQAAEQQESAPATEDNREMEIDPVAPLKQKEDSPAAEKNGVATKVQKEVDTAPTAAPAVKKQDVAPVDEEKQEVSPAAEEEQEVAHEAYKKQEAASVPEENQEVATADMEEDIVAPVSEEEQEGAPAAEKEDTVAVAAEELQEGDPVATQKKDETTVDVEEPKGAPSVQEVQDVGPEVVKNEVDSEEEQEVAPEMEKYQVVSSAEEEQHVVSAAEDKEVDPPTEETSSSPDTDTDGIEGQDEAMDVVSDIVLTGISVKSSKEEERQTSGKNQNNTLMPEEEETAQKEVETDEEGEENNVNEAFDISRVLRGTRTKVVPPTSKRTSKRLSKMTLEDEEEEHREAKFVEEDKGMSTEEEKVTTEEEAEHSSEEEEQQQDPPVIDKRVLRGKTKVIQSMQRTRAKRRSKM